MTTQTQRTPGPYEVRPYNDNFAIVRTTGRAGHVATVITEDDATFIVTACNAHDELVAALTLACGVLQQHRDGECGQADLDDLALRLDAALAKVTP